MELLTLTTIELDRMRTLQRVVDGYLTRSDASGVLGIGDRQLRRLLDAFARSGVEAVMSKRRGRPPNNRIAESVRAVILERCRGDYQRFGPTFLAQTLAERDGIVVSHEWLRSLLIENDLWKAKRRKRNLHPVRERRLRFGELVQMGWLTRRILTLILPWGFWARRRPARVMIQ